MQNITGPGVDRHGQAISLSIEPADVAAGPVEAHQTMDGRDLIECGIDRAVGISNW